MVKIIIYIQKKSFFSILRDKESVKKVFSVLSKRYQKRPGGYTRIIKSGFRYGDSSPMAVIEFLNRDKDAKGFKDRQRTKELKTLNQKNQFPKMMILHLMYQKSKKRKKENKDQTK